MKMNYLKAAAAIGLSALLADTAAAQNNAASSPVGYYTETLQQGFNVIGINLAGTVVDSGSIASVSGADFTVSGKDFGALLNDASATYFVETPSGTIAEIASAVGETVTLVGDAGLAANESYSIRAGLTLEQIFGDSLTAGATDAAADVVFVPTGEAGQFDRYFPSSLDGGNFRNAAAAFTPLPKPIAILFSDALLVERKSADPVDIVVTGSVKTTGTTINLPQGFYPVTVAPVVGGTLQNSGLADDLQAGTTDASADVVFVPGDSPGVFERYFVSTLDNSFRNAAAAFTPLTQDVPLDSAILVERKGDSTTAVFDVPPFFGNL